MEEQAAMPRRKQEILQAISTAAGWVNRNTIADLTGKRRLSPNDTRHLEALVAERQVEQRNVGTAERPQYEYRAQPS